MSFPDNAPEEAVAFWLIAELGQGFMDVYGKPFMELPPDVGARFLDIARRSVPWRLSLLKEIKDGVEAWTKNFGG